MSNGLINRQYVGARYVPKIMGEWNKALQYEALSVVTYMGNSFTSKIPVPANVDITNEDYWANTGNYNAQVESYKKEVIDFKNDIDDTINNLFINNIELKETTYNSDTTGHSIVYYCIIPSNNAPKLFIANDTINTVAYPETFINEISPSILINGGIFNESTSETIGCVIQDNNIIKENELYKTGTNNEILYCDKNNVLNSISANDITANELKNMGVKWCVNGWYSIYKNGTLTTSDTSSTHPRTFIGQDSNNNFIVICCDGRLYESNGLSEVDSYNFCLSINFIPKFLFMLDGGGSSSLYANGVRVNSYNYESRRKIANVIAFKTDKNNKSLMQTISENNIVNYTKNKSETTYLPTLHAKNIVNLSFTNNGVNGLDGVVRIDKGNGKYGYERVFKLLHDMNNNSVSLEGKLNTYKELIKFYDNDKLKIMGYDVDYKNEVKNGNIILTDTSNTFEIKNIKQCGHNVSINVQINFNTPLTNERSTIIGNISDISLPSSAIRCVGMCGNDKYTYNGSANVTLLGDGGIEVRPEINTKVLAININYIA